MLLVGIGTGALALLADALFSAPDTPRAVALLGFVNPIPAIWLGLTWLLLLGLEVFEFQLPWLQKMRRSLVEAFFALWGWFCGLAVVLYFIGLCLEQISGTQMSIMAIILFGSSLVIIGFTAAAEQLTSDTDIERAVRWTALAVALILICAYPALARWNAGNG